MRKILLIILLCVSATAMCQKITINSIQEKLTLDSNYTIKWNQENPDKTESLNVKIELLTIYDSNVDKTTITVSTVSGPEAIFEWEVKGDTDKVHQIKITDLNDTNIFAISEKFNITPNLSEKARKKTDKNTEPSSINPSLLSMMFIVNKDSASDLRKINIYEEDIITVLIEDISKKEVNNYYLKQVDVKDLSSAIKIGKTELLKGNNITVEESTKANIKFTIAKLEQGKSYKFLVMNKDIIEDQFYVDVNEIIHFEINIGPVYSFMPNPDFKEYPVTKDATGNVDTALIKDNGTKTQLNLVFGGVFHPWGYDPRADIGFRNIFLYLGIPLNQTLLENIYLGIGFGTHGFNLVGGAYIAKINRLTSGYNLDTRYAKKDYTLDNIIIKDYMVKLFAGVVLDLDIIGKIFTSIKK